MLSSAILKAFFIALALVPAVSVVTPLYGWCKGSHRPKKKAQSGYNNYCKACFKKKFPAEYAEKAAKRMKHCVICSNEGELVQKLFRVAHVRGKRMNVRLREVGEH